MAAREWLTRLFLKKPGTAEVRPVSHSSSNGTAVLDGIVLYRENEGGEGRLRLTVEQATVLQARLRQLKLAFHPESYDADAPHYEAGIIAPPHDPVYHGEEHGVKVWPVTQQVGDELPTLVEVLIRVDGKPFQLHPDELVYVDSRPTHILVAFLHENRWGGENAAMQ